MARLTDAAARSLKASNKAYEVADGGVPGLCLRIAVSGHKTWALRVRGLGGRVRVDLGAYLVEANGKRVGVGVAEARSLALNALKLAKRGENPEHAIRPPETGVTVETAIARWLQTKSGNRSIANERRRMELHVIPVIGPTDIAIPSASMRATLHKLVHDMAFGNAPKPVEANRVYTSLRGLFRWCVEAGLRPDDPSALFRKPTKEEPSTVRRREGTEPLLDMNELAKLWNAAPGLGGSVLSDLLMCLLLVPLRREEWTGLQWREVRENFTADGWKGTALQIPAARMKGRRPAVVPLSSTVIKILKARHKLTGRSTYVFSVPGRDTPFAGWRRGADMLRTALGAGLPVKDRRDDWSPHTIRASVATAMVRDLAGDELLVGRILQHSARSVLGITDTYQRSARLTEQAELLARWSEHLQLVASLADTESKQISRVVRLQRN
jgi:integrase